MSLCKDRVVQVLENVKNSGLSNPSPLKSCREDPWVGLTQIYYFSGPLPVDYLKSAYEIHMTRLDRIVRISESLVKHHTISTQCI